MRYVLTKSQPVPRGITATSTSARPAIPFTTSFTVPSPPTTTSRCAPASAASRARSARCPGRSESNASPRSPRPAALCASSGQRLPVAPFSDAGLTRKTTPLMTGDGRERDPGHPVDRRAQLVVGDPRELVADDDVAHGEQATGLDSAQRADREQDGSLHLDSEHATRRPALVPLGVGVVERVARGDRTDADGLLQHLRCV